jgi:NAD(P)-dependent dehydrogenase (short-subunit alcohol dehydrogenase family)
VPHLLPYSASKFALTGLSDGLHAELARENIAVTSVCPESLPGLAIDAERAAVRIVNACRYGEAEVIITLPAKLAVLARTVVPELVADAMVIANSLLPTPGSPSSGDAHRGSDSESTWAGPSSVLTASQYKAASEDNETNGAAFWGRR